MTMPPQAVHSFPTSDHPICAPVLAANLTDLNRELDDQAVIGAASESKLLGLLERMPEPELGDEPGYWPTLARLAELTLFSAACLALEGEFAACGDLLFNPDGKLLHIKGSPQPMAIKRHQAVTRQVAHLVPAGWHTIQWLKHQTFLELPQKALLPRLREKLQAWPRSGDYIEQLDRDTEALASSVVLLAGLDTGSPAGLREALARLSKRDRLWLEDRLYRPSLQRFHDLGLMIAGGG